MMYVTETQIKMFLFIFFIHVLCMYFMFSYDIENYLEARHGKLVNDHDHCMTIWSDQ